MCIRDRAKYSQAWRYYNSVEDGARVSKGWFKVVSAELLNEEKYNDDEDAWYYADGSGHLYAGEFKTIKGKKYAFRNDGRMIDGLKFIKDEGTSLDVIADDDDTFNFDNEDDFDLHAPMFEAAGYYCYYFGNGDDGAMRTNKNTVEIDGDKYNSVSYTHLVQGCRYVNKVLCDLGPVQISSIPEAFESVLFQYSI